MTAPALGFLPGAAGAVVMGLRAQSPGREGSGGTDREKCCSETWARGRLWRCPGVRARCAYMLRWIWKSASVNPSSEGLSA